MLIRPCNVIPKSWHRQKEAEKSNTLHASKRLLVIWSPKFLNLLKYFPSHDFHRSTPIWARPGFWKHILDQIWIFSQSRRKGSAKVKVVYARILMFLKWENTEIHLDPFMICSKMFKIRFSVKFTKAICFFGDESLFEGMQFSLRSKTRWLWLSTNLFSKAFL